PTALLVDAVAELDMGEEQIAAFAARVGISTTIVVGRQSGNVFLARSLRCNWDDSPERFESELNRSAIFMRQQFGLDIDCVWLAGPGSEAQSLRMLPEAALPIRVCPTELSAQYLGAQLLKLDPECSANLIDREQRDAPKRRLFVRISGGVIGLLLALSLLIAVLIEYQLHSETRTLAILQPKAAKLEEQKATLEKKFKNLNEHKEITTLLLEKRLPPVPGWLLSHITEVLPEELVITKVEVNRVDMLTQVGASAVPPEGIWRARVEGQGIPSKKVAPADVKAAYKHFSEALESGPFHMQITSATKHYAPRSIEGWIYTDGAPVDKSYQFFIEGVMEGSTVR
ncbi:MAG: hypothetical protein KDN22_28350, partial [Verrucomicrobiae bacterium]|nr:hypothetical protein [Verrucomicrobiae bacterium]